MNMGRMNNNSKGVEEMDRHMIHLKKEIENTNEKTVHGLENRDGELRRATLENKTLIQELKDLRDSRKGLQCTLKE